MSLLRRHLLLVALTVTFTVLRGAERIPPAPAHYFNDYAGVVSPAVAGQLNARLEQFERESSNQLLVAIYPRMESNSAVEDYTVRIAQAWKIGQKVRNNGAVLFAFMQEHQLYIQVGYGLEGALPDATAKRIIEDEIVPRFRTGNIDGGMQAAVGAMIAATKGEYRGTGRTKADSEVDVPAPFVVLPFIFVLFLLGWLLRNRTYSRPIVIGTPRIDDSLNTTNTWWNIGSSNWSSSSSDSSDWGGFSGGGGSFGGGGAGGKW